MNITWMTWENPVFLWWLTLSLISLLNIALWSYSWATSRPFKNNTDLLFPRTMMALSGIYVFGCAFRSFIPRADVQRLVLFDSWISSVFVGRSVATVAELCFIAQWALILYIYSKSFQLKKAKFFSISLLPLIFLAEVFSWFGVTTTNNLAHVFEESLWALSFFIISAILVVFWRYIQKQLQLLVGMILLGCLIYVGYMVFVDVPMYYGRYLNDIQTGKEFLNLSQGFHELNTEWHVSRTFSAWKDEMLWMALYFSIAVWVSLGLCHVPFPKWTSFPKERLGTLDKTSFKGSQ